MNILTKKQVHPIIIPTPRFQDRFGNQDAYVDMNPSIHIDEQTGETIIFVRMVNYRKYPNNAYTVYENKARTIYGVLRGTMNENQLNLDTFHIQSLEVHYQLPTYPSWWSGVEDIRFVSKDTVLACVPECNPQGSPSIFQATFHASTSASTLTAFQPCQPSLVEKNWMPYWDDAAQAHKVIYSVSPFYVKSIQKDDREEIPLTPAQRDDLKGWHGSSNAIDLFGQKVCLIHKNMERVYHRWLLFDPVQKRVHASKPFVFFPHSYIEFVCSLAQYQGTIYISVGVNDNKSCIVEVEQTAILPLFDAKE
jgi:hypothetical protein